MPVRPLALRREALTSLDADRLVVVAGGEPFTLGGCATTMVDSYGCPVSENPLLQCHPSAPASRCC